MKKHNAKVRRVAYFGWRGMVGCEVLELGEGPMTGLLGPSGAGKTTLALCLANALLPDRQVLDIQPISEVRDNQSAGTDVLAGKIDPASDYAYVVLDISARDDTRLLAGIFAVKADGRAQLTRWLVRNAPEELNLKDLLAEEHDGGEVSYPEFPRLKQVLAARGIDVETCPLIGDYGEALFEAGILPSGMRTRSDRTLYANLLKSTFRGGLSGEVALRLKDYLLTAQTQVPDIVRGLQECADEIFKTRSAISDADRELTLLKSTYGAGRDVVARSIRWIAVEKAIFEEQKRDQEEMLEELTNRGHELNGMVASVNGSIAEAERKKAEAVESAWQDLERLKKALEGIRGQRDAVRDRLASARRDNDCYQAGKDIWLKVSKLTIADTYDEAREWFRTHIGDLRKKESRLEGDIEELLEKIQRIELNRPSAGSESLQGVLGGDTLETVFGGLEEDRALAVDLSLSGVTDGLVGVDKDDLADVPHADDFPENFWIGLEKPAAQAVEEKGDWLIIPSRGGHVVTRSGRTTVFGARARARLREEYESQREKLQGEIFAYRKEIAFLTNDDSGLETLFNRRREEILFYLDKREHFELENLQATLEKQFNALYAEFKVKNNEIKTAEKTCRMAGKPFDDELSALHKKLNEAQVELEKIKLNTGGTQKLIEEHTERLESIYREEADVKSELAEEYAVISAYAGSERLSDFDFDEALDDLAGKIADLKMVFTELIPERADFFNRLRARDRVTTASLWPVLTDLVRERINIDLADSDGMDLIQDAQDRRAELGDELERHEQNARVKARSIANTIKTTINQAKLRIRKLSRLGHDIRFGNIVGVQLRLVEKSQMIELLDNITGQLALYATNKPIDVAIKEWFDRGLGEEKARHLSGEDLLDYRNYVDFAVEAKWKGGGWEPVASASLSGGESIGCGLALALMLMRSIAGRGESKPEAITPLFAMDEIHRLDDAGVAMIVNLARRENFQVVVTAQKIEPSYDCTLYNLTRLPDPDRLVIRGIRVKRQEEAA